MFRAAILVILLHLFSGNTFGQPSEMLAPVIFSDAFASTLPMSEPDLLVRYLQIPSESGQEQEAGTFLRNICRETGLFIRQFGDQDGNFNFAASLYPLHLDKPNIILLNHIDVVPVGENAHWSHPPFEGRQVNNEIWGRGAFDNKGAAIMQLSAIAQFVSLSREVDLPFNVTFLAVSCEETQCEGGARYVVENHLEELNPWTVIGEGPPSLEGVVTSDPDKLVFGIATAHKRAFWVKLELELHTSGHGSVTPLAYANQQMILALEKLVSKKRKAIYTPENLAILRNLGRLEGGIKGFVLKKPRLFKPLIVPQLRKQPEVFSLFTNTVTLTNLSNPTTAHNTIPEKITCLLDCRLLPQTNETTFFAELQEELSRQDIRASVVMQTPRTAPTPVDHPAFQAMVQAIREHYGVETEVVPLVLPNLNDSGWFRAKGIPVFDIIPARVSRQHLYCVHNYDERIPLEALMDGSGVFTDFIEVLMMEGMHNLQILANE